MPDSSRPFSSKATPRNTASSVNVPSPRFKYNRSEDVEAAVPVVIPGSDPHARQFAAVLVESDAAQHSLFRKRPVPPVQIQQPRRLIADDVDIRTAVVVDVGDQHAQSVVAGHLGDPGPLR